MGILETKYGNGDVTADNNKVLPDDEHIKNYVIHRLNDTGALLCKLAEKHRSRQPVQYSSTIGMWTASVDTLAYCESYECNYLNCNGYRLLLSNMSLADLLDLAEVVPAMATEISENILKSRSNTVLHELGHVVQKLTKLVGE